MGKGRDISKEKQAEILALLLHSNYTQAKIANLCNVSQTVVSFIKNGHKKNARENCGRKLKTTKRQDRTIINTVLKLRSQTIFFILHYLRMAYQIIISRNTLRRRLKAAKIKSCKKSKKFLLNPKMMLKRRKFAWNLRNWTIRQWNRVMSSS